MYTTDELMQMVGYRPNRLMTVIADMLDISDEMDGQDELDILHEEGY